MPKRCFHYQRAEPICQMWDFCFSLYVLGLNFDSCNKCRMFPQLCLCLLASVCLVSFSPFHVSLLVFHPRLPRLSLTHVCSPLPYMSLALSVLPLFPGFVSLRLSVCFSHFQFYFDSLPQVFPLCPDRLSIYCLCLPPSSVVIDPSLSELHDVVT